VRVDPLRAKAFERRPVDFRDRHVPTEFLLVQRERPLAAADVEKPAAVAGRELPREGFGS
jgi:hypothetical protein